MHLVGLFFWEYLSSGMIDINEFIAHVLPIPREYILVRIALSRMGVL